MPDPGSSRVRETFKICSIIAVTAIVVALAVPVAVEAAGSFVTIEDADSTDRAQVDNGSLRIGDGNGSPNSLTVNGWVTARTNTPVNAVRAHSDTSSSACVELHRPPAGKATIIKSLRVSVYQPGTSNASFVRLWIGTSPCTFTPGIVAFSAVTGRANDQQLFSQGLNVPAGSAVYVDQYVGQGNTAGGAGVAIDGYNVEAGTVPSSNAEQSPSNTGGATGGPLHGS